MVVLPVPGPPVRMETLEANASLTPAIVPEQNQSLLSPKPIVWLCVDRIGGREEGELSISQSDFAKVFSARSEPGSWSQSGSVGTRCEPESRASMRDSTSLASVSSKVAELRANSLLSEWVCPASSASCIT